MKNLIILTLTMMALSSCSFIKSTGKKLSLDEKIGSSVQKVLEKEFESAEYSDLSCEYEAAVIGAKFKDAVSSMLESESNDEVKSFSSKSSKSLAGEVGKLACKGLMQSVLPMALNSIGNISNYKCSSRFFIGGADKLADKVCNWIK